MIAQPHFFQSPLTDLHEGAPHLCVNFSFPQRHGKLGTYKNKIEIKPYQFLII